MNIPMKRILYILPALLLMVSCGGQNNKSLSETSKMSDADITACALSMGACRGVCRELLSGKPTLSHSRKSNIYTTCLIIDAATL
jgi:hypothetical protein